MSCKVFIISDTSPSSATTTVGDTATASDNATFLGVFDWFTIDATLTGGTGGTLDVYLQRKVTDDVWADWLHFPQLAAGASAIRYCANTGASTSITTVGGGSDASPGVALAANTFIGGHPGFAVRSVYVAGASTSAGAAQVIRITGWRRSI